MKELYLAIGFIVQVLAFVIALVAVFLHGDVKMGITFSAIAVITGVYNLSLFRRE